MPVGNQDSAVRPNLSYALFRQVSNAFRDETKGIFFFPELAVPDGTAR